MTWNERAKELKKARHKIERAQRIHNNLQLFLSQRQRALENYLREEEERMRIELDRACIRPIKKGLRK